MIRELIVLAIRNCPLSPLIGAIFLSRLDEAMEATGLFYARFMDDWVVLAPTRWKLRRAVRVINQILNDLCVEQHPDKTFVGRVERERLDFLGYHLASEGLSVAAAMLRQFENRVSRLYERDSTGRRVRDYVKRFPQSRRSGSF